MKTSQIMLLNAFTLAVLAMSGTASANETNKEGYVLDTRGAIVMSGTGLCVHTSRWTPAMAIEGCDFVAKKPEPVIAAKTTPAPQPAAVIAGKTVFVPFSLETEALFTYNKAELRPQGKQRISDEVVDKMKEYSKDNVIVISGYADRIGNPKYNMALSQSRADAVKAYLVEQGIDGSRIETVAKGEADPVVSCDNIKGRANRYNKALIACLQPNRRIVLDLKGEMPVQK